jgi:hypothetical protein
MTKTYGAGRAESVAQEFSHGGLNQPFFVSQIVQDVAAGGELVGDTSEN